MIKKATYRGVSVMIETKGNYFRVWNAITRDWTPWSRNRETVVSDTKRIIDAHLD